MPDEQITVLIDDAATRPNILKAMDRMTAMAGEDDVILIYTSGHGLKGSFVPYDFDGTTKNLISYEEWFTKLDKAVTKHKLFIADACHSGSMIASARSAWEADLGVVFRQVPALVTVGELYDFVSSEVNKYTAGAQNPTISGTYDSGMPVAMVRRR
ncbi:MAG: caspase family protein [Saprospiraceae bacterium]|nr:caspase family protein [Saprospiraceae bacterium]